MAPTSRSSSSASATAGSAPPKSTSTPSPTPTKRPLTPSPRCGTEHLPCDVRQLCDVGVAQLERRLVDHPPPQGRPKLRTATSPARDLRSLGDDHRDDSPPLVAIISSNGSALVIVEQPMSPCKRVGFLVGIGVGLQRRADPGMPQDGALVGEPKSLPSLVMVTVTLRTCSRPATRANGHAARTSSSWRPSLLLAPNLPEDPVNARSGLRVQLEYSPR